jgi:hypothetical protein
MKKNNYLSLTISYSDTLTKRMEPSIISKKIYVRKLQASKTEVREFYKPISKIY